MKTIIKIDGMGCDRCVHSVTAALREVGGIEVINVEIGSAEIDWGDDSLLAQAKSAIEDCGFELVD